MMMKVSKGRKRVIFYVYILILIIGSTWYFSRGVDKPDEVHPPIITGTVATGINTTGVTTNIESTGTENLTLIGRLEKVLKEGKGGDDYLRVTAYPQPVLHGTKSENTNVMHLFIDKYSYTFTLPPSRLTGYILFTTKDPIVYGRDLYIGIDKVTLGPINKSRSLPTNGLNQYLYPMDRLPLTVEGVGTIYNLFKKAKDGKLTLGTFVTEQGNSVKEISIIFTE